jgi:hypothetical protein
MVFTLPLHASADHVTQIAHVEMALPLQSLYHHHFEFFSFAPLRTHSIPSYIVLPQTVFSDLYIRILLSLT